MNDDMIKIAKDFQYAINIAFDAEDSNKLKNYIFTAGGLDLFRKLFTSVVDDNNDKSHFLIGPYGKGKSHLALVLLNLLNLNNSESMETVLKQISLLDKNFYADIEDFYSENKRMLPVIIENNGNQNIQQLFLIALKKALTSKGLESIIPDSYFSCAKDTVLKWKDKYKETYKEFCKKINCSIESFLEHLDNFDDSYYLQFINIYPEITSGSVFYADVTSNAVLFYQDVNKKLCKKGYKGIYVVFDEFSKYLEANVNKNSSEDLKFLQDFAEAANRTKKEQIHLLLITHQSLLNYVDKLSKVQIDNWKAVSNRFSELHLNTSISQYYKLISKIIIKNEDCFQHYFIKHNEEFTSINQKWAKAKCFNDIRNDDFNEIALRVFPLHPSSLYILPTLSEKIAQNERTIFTFLASDTQLNTLSEFLNKHNFEEEDNISYVTPDLLFDYFSPLFDEESFKSVIFKTNKKVIAALSQIPNEPSFNLHKKIIKTIGILSIINSTNMLPVTEETICDIYTQDETISAIKYLLQNRIINKLEFAKTINFPDYADIDINSLIENRLTFVKRNFSIIDILNNFVSRKVFYPVQYNEDYGVTRFFRVEFIKDSEISLDKYKDSISNNFADGIIYLVLGTNADKISNFDNIPSVFILHKNLNENFEDYIYKYKAVEDIKNKTEDIVTKEVFESIKKDYEAFLIDVYEGFFNFSIDNKFYVFGTNETIKNRIALSERVSEKLAIRFNKMPIILNEMINKNNVSIQTVGKCKKIFEVLYEQTLLLPNLGFNSGSQENTIIKSVFGKNRIFYEKNNSCVFEPLGGKVQEANQNLYDVLKIIYDYLLNTDVNFLELYLKLQNEIGLRRGLIPLLIGAVLYNFREQLYFYNDGLEYSINADIIYKINDAPQDFFIKHINKDPLTENYLSQLKDIFRDYITYTDKNLNENDRIVKGFAKWYVALPNYTKSCLTGSDKELLKPLGSLHINTNEYLFHKIPDVLGVDFEKAPDLINKLKLKLDSFISFKILQIKESLYKLFNAANDSELDKNISTWYQSLSAETKNHVFNNYTSNIFILFEGSHSDINSFICELIVKDFGLRIEDWNKIYTRTGQETIEYFIEKLNNFKLSYDKFEEKQKQIKLDSVQKGVNRISSSSYAIQFPDINNKNAIVKTFEFQKSHTKAERFLTNEVKNIIEEYQESLTAEQKCNVFFNIIQEILGI